MAKLRINGRELVVKQINKARVRDIIELQRQSGLKTKDMREQAQESDVLAMAIVSFLTQHNAGFTVKWADLIDGDYEAIGEWVSEPGDDSEGEAEEDADPTTATATAFETSAPVAPVATAA